MDKFDEWGNAELPPELDPHTVSSLLLRWLELLPVGILTADQVTGAVSTPHKRDLTPY